MVRQYLLVLFSATGKNPGQFSLGTSLFISHRNPSNGTDARVLSSTFASSFELVCIYFAENGLGIAFLPKCKSAFLNHDFPLRSDPVDVRTNIEHV
jgi:hypothetical protein